MPAEAFEDALDLRIGLIEARLPEPGDPSYPYPALTPTEQEDTRTFRTVLLENAYLRVTVVPDLGGRILSFFDKRTNTEILPTGAVLRPEVGGRRGAVLRDGIGFRLDHGDRPNALGSVDTLVEPLGEEDAPAVAWIAETGAGSEVSFHLRLSLPADRAVLELEARVLNRGLEPVHYDGGLAMPIGEADTLSGSEWFAWYDITRRAGLGIVAPDLDSRSHRFGTGELSLSRFGWLRSLAPRQVDTWSATLVPISGFEDLRGFVDVSTEGVILRRLDRVELQTVAPRLGHKMILALGDGQTFEAPVDVYPERMLSIPLEGLPAHPNAVVLRDPMKRDVMRVDEAVILPTGGRIEQAGERLSPSGIDLETQDFRLRQAAFGIAERHLAHTLLGLRALGRAEYDAADFEFEQALSYNADDPLLWWSKAVAGRLRGDEAEERAELLNAHYLAPLEPLLRAEAFLSAPPPEGREPSPLLMRLAPEAFIEVAARLVEAGLFADATRWIDEALRHGDLVMLRYLQAYALLTASRMEAEAAEQVAAAARLPFGPPFPYRAIERRALGVLVDRFPDDERLGRFADFVSA